MEQSHNFQTKFAAEAYADTRQLWDTPLYESESFVALPTVGALVGGWLLVVPKTPVISMARLDRCKLAELGIFLDDVVSTLESIYGSVSVFEHGPSASKNLVGCGVDYAHLHLVPTKFDLLAGAKKLAPNVEWSQIRSFDEIQNTVSSEDDYWFLKQNYFSDVCYLGKCRDGKPQSQLFRKVIAGYIGRPLEYDWKGFLGHAQLASTVQSLSRKALVA